MAPVGGAQARGARAERDGTSESQSQRTAGQGRNDMGDQAKWLKLKGILNEITDSLAGVQEEGVREKIRSKVVLAARAADALYGQTVSQAHNTMVKLVKEMDKKMDALRERRGRAPGPKSQQRTRPVRLLGSSIRSTSCSQGAPHNGPGASRGGS